MWLGFSYALTIQATKSRRTQDYLHDLSHQEACLNCLLYGRSDSLNNIEVTKYVAKADDLYRKIACYSR
jgi:hypothetical protein